MKIEDSDLLAIESFHRQLETLLHFLWLVISRLLREDLSVDTSDPTEIQAPEDLFCVR